MSKVGEMVGRQFGRLTVERPHGFGIRWQCLCTCGRRAVIKETGLKNGDIQSCGCRDQDIARQKWWIQHLRVFAQELSVRFNAPVVLIGSTLRKVKPRDINIRVLMPHAEFKRRYDCGIKYARENEELDAELQLLLPPGIGADVEVMPMEVWEWWNVGPFVILAAMPLEDQTIGLTHELAV